MKSVLITGASRGIGRATAIACAKRGTQLGLLGRVSAEQREAAMRIGASEPGIENPEMRTLAEKSIDGLYWR